MTNAILERVRLFPDFLSPLRDAVLQHLGRPSAVLESGTMKIRHRPWVAPQNYLFVLYPGSTQQDISAYSQHYGIEIPAAYAAVLREISGAFCCGMSLFGIPEPKGPEGGPLVLQCHDLATATLWALRYGDPLNQFHFGYRHFTPSENVGYFLDEGNRICCYRETGELIRVWNSFERFLSDELAASEALEDQWYPPPRY